MSGTKEQHGRHRQDRRLSSNVAAELVVSSTQIAKLHLNSDNPRRHPERQLHHLVKNLKEFGFLVPLLIDGDGLVLAGHARVEAARRLGWEEVPAIRIDHLSEVQKKAFMVADNRLAELATWDRAQLKTVILDLTTEVPDFDVEITGFVTSEVDILLEGSPVPIDGTDPDDHVAEPAGGVVPTSRLGDLFELGDHRLHCGDALVPDTYTSLLGSETCQMAFTDAPYNLRARDIGGLGRTKHADFAMASGEMSEAGFTAFLTDVHRLMAKHCRDGAILFSCMDWRHVLELSTAGASAGLALKNICVWVKDNGGMGSFYRSRHELVFAFKSGTAQHINNFGLGQTGRYRTNVWEYAGANTFREGREEDLAAHPTVKPVALVADAIRDCSHRGGLVLDPFCGSGTTILAAERTSRRARCIELDPRYVDVTIERWQRKTGREAIHIETGLTFSELKRQRQAAAAIRTRRRSGRPTVGEAA